MRRPRRVGIVIFAAACLAGIVVVATRALSDGRAGPDLSPSHWAQLRVRLIGRVQQPPSDSAPSVPLLPPDTVVQRRTRVAWPPEDPAIVRRQGEEYAANRPKTVLELQPLRRTVTVPISNHLGEEGSATLVNLNPHVNAWYLLTVSWSGTPSGVSYHLTNADPRHADLTLDPLFPHGIVLRDSAGDTACDLWSGTGAESIVEASAADEPYVPLCGDRLSLRLQTAGRKTSLEKVTDFLRNHVWGGEAITVFVREKFFVDAFMDTAQVHSEAMGGPRLPDAPAPAVLNAQGAGSFLAPAELGIAVEGALDGRLEVGTWYGAQDLPGVFLSIIRPDLIAREILDSHSENVAPLDDVERQALSYLMAFDLGSFELGFALGTDHPRVGWSERVPAVARDASLPGPDGIGTISPLVSTGIIGQAVVDRVAATFTGGFKRTHGAFRSGDLSLVNHGSHYGFIENGVILSKLQPGLATLVVYADGTVDMTTWTAAHDTALARVRFARQNGVPLVEPDSATDLGIPGPLVSRWSVGNWSGSQEGRVRTLRAGACIQERQGARFLIYAYFSTATPAAMARVFQAYGCAYAMLLDMNALEHTYAAVYRVRESALEVQHLIRGMEVLDRTREGVTLPRFLGYADNRDFFYLLWSGQRED